MSLRTISQSAAFTGNQEERRETGLSLVIIGFMLWCFDALVVFFLPAGLRLGQQRPFLLLVGLAFVLGAVLMAIGAYLRKK